MILIHQPLVQPDPPDLAERLEAKIAAMLAITPVEPSPQKERKPRFRNGMTAMAEWETTVTGNNKLGNERV